MSLQHYHRRHTQCNVCHQFRKIRKLNIIKCSFCVSCLKSSNNSILACDHCVQKFDLCNKNKSDFCKQQWLKTLNCSTKSCVNSKGRNNKKFYIIKSRKGNKNLGWEWKSGFYGYKLNMNQKYIKIIQRQTHIIPYRIDDSWYRIFCEDCTLSLDPIKPCKVDECENLELNGSVCINHNQCECITCGKSILQWSSNDTRSNYKICGNSYHIENKCGDNDRCIECETGKQLLDVVKKDINDSVKYNQYLRQQIDILYGSTKDAIKSRFCDDITNIIFALCIGHDIGADLMCAVQCNCTRGAQCYHQRFPLYTIWVIQGIGSKLYAKINKNKSYDNKGYSIDDIVNANMHHLYYMVDAEYVHQLSPDQINKELHLIQGNYYRIFCSTRESMKCLYPEQCNNKEITKCCWNHMICNLCNNYVLIQQFEQCKYCNYPYHRDKCGDDDECCGHCLVKYVGIIKSYNHTKRSGIIQIRGKMNEFSNCKLLLPFIHKLNDYNKSTKIQQPLINALQNMFKKFATNDNNTMSKDDMKRYILHCLPNKNEKFLISRTKQIFLRFGGKSKTSLSMKKFLDFYAKGILNRPQNVIDDLTVFGFKQDVLFKAYGECINASFGDYKYRRRYKHRLVVFEIIRNDDGSKHAIHVTKIN